MCTPNTSLADRRTLSRVTNRQTGRERQTSSGACGRCYVRQRGIRRSVGAVRCTVRRRVLARQDAACYHSRPDLPALDHHHITTTPALTQLHHHHHQQQQHDVIRNVGTPPNVTRPFFSSWRHLADTTK